MERIITIANQKGGVGKTTCAMNIGYGLATMGRTILLVDLDPQANLTACCEVGTDSVEKTIYDVFGKVCPLTDTIEAVRENYNPVIRVDKVIPVMYSKTILANEMLKQLKNHFNHTLPFIRIRRNVKIGEATAVGKSILAYEPGSINARDFTDLFREFI